jgi:hypothetical protein
LLYCVYSVQQLTPLTILLHFQGIEFNEQFPTSQVRESHWYSKNFNWRSFGT